MVTGRSTAAQAEREEAAPSKNTNSFESTKKGQAWPSHFVGENKGPKGEQTSTRAAHTHGGKAINTKEKMAKHTSKGIAARAQREGAAPGGSTKHTKQKHDPMYPLHRKERREETSAKLTSKQKGAG